MSTSFWGHRMTPGESYRIKYKGILQLNQISLEGEPKDGKTMLKVKAKGHTFVLCTLVKNKVERQELSHFFIAEDDATLILSGTNPVNLVGALEEDNDYSGSSSNSEDEKDEDEEMDEYRETITGQPRYPEYLSDLLGPDLPDEDDDDYEDDSEDVDDYGSLAFRDPTDNEFLGGFELRHFNLAPNVAGFEKVDLREQEETIEDSLLNDNIAKGLVNALINSGDDFQVKKGKQFLRKLKKQCISRNKQQQEADGEEST